MQTIGPLKKPVKHDSHYPVSLFSLALIVSAVAVFALICGMLLPGGIALSPGVPPTPPAIPGVPPTPPVVPTPGTVSDIPLPFNIWDTGNFARNSIPHTGALGEWPIVVWVDPGYINDLSGNIAYISDPATRLVYTLNTDSGDIAPAFWVSDGPEYCILSKDGKKAYISIGKELVIAYTQTGFIINKFSYDKEISLMSISADGSRLLVYTSNVSEPGALDVLDTGTDRRLGSIKNLPYSWGMDPGPSITAYLCDYFQCRIAIVTAGGDQIGYWKQTLNCASPKSYSGFGYWKNHAYNINAGFAMDVAMSPDCKYLYVSRSGIDKFSLVSLASYQVFKEVTVPGRNSTGIAVSPDGASVYLASYDTGQVLVFDAVGNAVDQIKVKDRPLRVEVSGDGKRLLVNYHGGGLDLINLTTGTIRSYGLSNPGIWFPAYKY
ncbi:MAG TPA: hypothetical protein VGJ92_11145 [Methanocella sp.]|jgi:hypothetical protein